VSQTERRVMRVWVNRSLMGKAERANDERVIVQVVNSFHVMFCIQIFQSRLSRKSFPRTETISCGRSEECPESSALFPIIVEQRKG
jgi:hypothetical protein